jgi:hypothetical protein
MSIPAEADGTDVVSVLTVLFRQLHAELRAEIEVVDEQGLAWAPGEDTNSIMTLIVHLLGSEAETLQVVSGTPCRRNRDAEFEPRAASKAELVARIAEADHLLGNAVLNIQGESLTAERTLPTLPDDESRSGITWLLANYGHAREHLGQLLLTKQLYEQARARAKNGTRLS